MDKHKINYPDRDFDFVTGAYSDLVLIDGFLFIIGQGAVVIKISNFILGSINL